MFSYTRAALLLVMTLCVSAPIIYADAQNNTTNKPYYIVGHGIIVRQGPNPLGPNLDTKPCSAQTCTAPKSGILG